MQVYRGMDIGTAKPRDRKNCSGCGIIWSMWRIWTRRFDAARFVRLAGAAAAEIQSRGRGPIFCGGTGLYFKAYREGLGEAPPGDAALRAELETQPLERLLAELEMRDPATFQRIDKKNPRRVIRALEVIRLTGRPVFRTAGALGGRRVAGASACFGLTRPAGELQERIARRVEEMFARGLVAETGLCWRAVWTESNGPAGAGLPAGGGTFARPAALARNDRTGQNPHPPVRQTPAHMVPAVKCGWNRFPWQARQWGAWRRFGRSLDYHFQRMKFEGSLCQFTNLRVLSAGKSTTSFPRG